MNSRNELFVKICGGDVMSGIWTLWMLELMLSMVWFVLINYSPSMVEQEW